MDGGKATGAKRTSKRRPLRSWSIRCAALSLVVCAQSGCATTQWARSKFAAATSGTVRSGVSSQLASTRKRVPRRNLASNDADLAIRPVAFAGQSTDADDSVVVPTVDVLAPEVGSVVQPEMALNSGAMTLEDFQSLAFENNPTLGALAATTGKAAGFRMQVGLKANPTIGYQAMQLADQGTDQHTAFVEQEFVTGGKLELNRRVLNSALRSQKLELQAQQLRVSTDIAVKFYAALRAQRRIELIEEFRPVTDKGLELATLRLEALEGSRVDVLQAKVQKNEVDLALQQARVAWGAAWRDLAATAGVPNLGLAQVSGELPAAGEPQDWEATMMSIAANSPEYHAAQARIMQAKANLRRQGVQSIPNITAQLATGVDNATDSGLLNLQFSAPIPVFNKNQGNIAAARSEYCRAVMDAKRIENAIQARLALVSRDFDSSLAAVATYVEEILPSARELLDLAEVAYKSGETSFVQVLVARRTYFQSHLKYVDAQTQLAQANSQVQGYVLSGGLDPVVDQSGDDSLRGLTFSQQ